MRIRDRIRKHLVDPGEKREYVRSLFAGIARRYDITNDVMSLGLHRRWKRMLLDLARLPPNGRVLDLAAGTGDLALEARDRLGEGSGVVVAADLTREMLEIARQRPGAEGVEWVEADALGLPFPPGSFDRVVVGYGLRNLAELETGLEETFRVLRPGGRLLSLDFGKPRSPLLRRSYLRYLEASTAAVGWLLHRDPEAYLYIPESLRRYPGQDELVDLLGRAGFVSCGYVDLLFGTMALHFAERPRREASSGGRSDEAGRSAPG